jgi:hypothetical protein
MTTVRAASSAHHAHAAKATHDLKRGDHGPAVKTLQDDLVKLGFMTDHDQASGPGIFGPHTQASLERFQHAHHLPMSGTLNPATHAALSKAIAAHKPAHKAAPTGHTHGSTPAGAGWVDAKASPTDARGRWTPQHAVAWAEKQVKHPAQNYHDLCDHFVAACYGFGYSGYPTARAQAYAVPSKLRHAITDPKKIPAGALVFWPHCGSQGHIAISVGDGKVASNDILRRGKIDIVNVDTITHNWGAGQPFWCPPYFKASGGHNPHP